MVRNVVDDGINRDELPEVCIVVNGPLGISEGKAVGQAFQAAFRSLPDIEAGVSLHDWIEAGTRTIVKIAETPTIFERVCTEVPGFVMRDEGYTEVDAEAATLFVSYPYLHKDRPKVLNNKKCPLL